MTVPPDLFDRSLPSPLATLAALRASGEESVVATGRLSSRQQAMYVVTSVDEALADKISTDSLLRLVLLTGSAGGGKSALIRQLESRLPAEALSRVVEDATHADSPSERQTERLAGVLAGFEQGVPPAGDLTLIAANTGLLLELHREFTGRKQHAQAEVVAYALKVLGVPGSRALDAARKDELDQAVLVVDLDQRPTSGGEGRLLHRMLASLSPQDPAGVLGGAERCRSCTVTAWCAPRANAALLADPQIGTSLDEAVEQVALRRGRDIAPRQLWDGIAELALGGISTEGDPCEAVARIAAAGDAEAVWKGLLPNGAFISPHSELVRELAGLDPSYRASDEAHTVIAAVGIDPQADAGLLTSVLGQGGESREAVSTGAQALAAHTPPEAARGLVRAHWLTGRIPLGAVVPTEFKAAVEQQDDAVNQVIDVVCDGLVSAFGRKTSHETFLPTESLAESRTARVLVQISLPHEVDVWPQRARTLNPAGCAVVGWRPLTARLKIGKGVVDLDLPLYELLQRASKGALPATVDVERFHSLRYAAERLGRAHAGQDSRPLLVTDEAQGTAFLVTSQQRRGQQRLKIEKVA
ncbi:hypothetical protein ACFCWV_25735 [Streptomyces sp. NPDC056341]|uniref:hypothetical protein n=1 Tax=Streptomyces sp. NPDC056341 TaxID=3345788 RepID=UPI0035E2BAA9